MTCGRISRTLLSLCAFGVIMYLVLGASRGKALPSGGHSQVQLVPSVQLTINGDAFRCFERT